MTDFRWILEERSRQQDVIDNVWAVVIIAIAIGVML